MVGYHKVGCFRIYNGDRLRISDIYEGCQEALRKVQTQDVVLIPEVVELR